MLKRIPMPQGHYGAAAKIDLSQGKITVTDHDDGTFTIPVVGSGKARAFNLKYLKGFAQQFGTIQLAGKDNSGDPVRILTEDPAYLGVLMPMRV